MVRVQDQLKKVWPKMKAELDLPPDSASFGKRQAANDFDMVSYTIGPPPDPVLELLSTNYTSPTGSRNYGRFSNSEFDALVDKALTQLDAEERKTTLLAAQDILLEEMHAIPVSLHFTQHYFKDVVKGNEDVHGRLTGSGAPERALGRTWLDV